MGSPAILDGQASTLLDRMNKAVQAVQNRVDQGAQVSDGGITQGSGAGTPPNFDVDVAELFAQVGGVPTFLIAQTDADSDAGDTVNFAATSGVSVVFAVVLETGALNDTPAIQAVPGAVATAGSEVAPTEAEIDTTVTHSNWILLGDITVERTADTSVTVTISNLRRGGIRGKVAAGSSFTSDLSITEAEWSA